MKIGIVTLPPSFNYGNILQAWALQSVIERMGHSVEIVIGGPRMYKLKTWAIPLVYAKRLYLKYFKGNRNLIVMQESALRVMLQNTEVFIQNYLHIKEYTSFNKICSDAYDAYVVGSDQIWRRRYVKDIRNSYLSFTDGWDVKRIAYAASFGTSKWEYSLDEEQDCAKLLAKFDGISVREKSAVDLVKSKFKLEAKHVLDPTLLLDKEDYIALIEKSNTPKHKGNMFCYLLGNELDYPSKIEEIAHARGLLPFYVKSQFENQNIPLEERIQPSVEEWIRGFYDADLVVTDSFHATVFSIIFQKPFILFGSGVRGNERMESLLEMAGLNSNSDITGILFEPNKETYLRLKALRKDALTFLAESI